MIKRIEIHLHIDSLSARHHVMQSNESPFGFHSGFSRVDAEAGWKQVMEIGTDSPHRIEQAKAEAVESARLYWENLLTEKDRCVIDKGVHFVAHPPGGTGFGGQLFRVYWLDNCLAPSLCNLSYQGRIPAWMRERMPDNAVIAKA